MGIGTPALHVGHVLDLDPELGFGIGGADWEKARRACRGPVIRVRPGIWERREDAERVARLGAVIVEGIVCREVTLGEHHMFELLGPGDVVTLPDATARHWLAGRGRLTAAGETILIGLGEEFARAAARWPCLLEAVLARLDAQRERLALQGLVAHGRRAEDRLLLVMWLLADRWGQNTPKGTVLSLALTHELLGQLTASRRSTATVAVGMLEAAGAIRRLADGSWLLTAVADRQVSTLARESPSAATLGESFMPRQPVIEASLQARALRAEARQIRTAHQAGQRARRSRRSAMPDGRASARDGVSEVDRSEQAGRAVHAASAADTGADAARRRAQHAAHRETELAEQRAPSAGPQNANRPAKQAAARAASAARSTKAPQARATRAHRRAAAALENAAAKHEQAAAHAAAVGDSATATRHRELAMLARKDAQRARSLEQTDSQAPAQDDRPGSTRRGRSTGTAARVRSKSRPSRATA